MSIAEVYRRIGPARPGGCLARRYTSSMDATLFSSLNQPINSYLIGEVIRTGAGLRIGGPIILRHGQPSLPANIEHRTRTVGNCSGDDPTLNNSLTIVIPSELDFMPGLGAETTLSR